MVFVLLWALARLARRGVAGRGAGLLTVIARQQLSRGSSVAVVKVADRALVLGVTDAGVSLLAEADAELFAEPPQPQTLAGSPLAGSLFSAETWRFLRGRR
ncbi:flagellar biosynthetic protein FliO [Dactylosporangium sp. NPDC005555]|uniref:flagellar biosynthetic protein FliO n=1 Tax=Dactylosporangium sp. NPDC005555 TaxID=3154889 RepID=UPI0033AE4645